MALLSVTGSSRKAIVDNDLVETLARHTWRVGGAENRYVCATIKQRQVYLHRLILRAPRGVEIDHINGDDFDCRRSNMRYATRRQQCANMKSRAKKVPYKGIARAGRNLKLWQARIRMPNGTRPCLGTFRTPEDAARAYDKAARRVHGEFACVNFPRRGERGALDG